jgi:UDP-GlcNAc:undecaprenyl-phosphate GlcNAc-1-phosphate transferase
LGGLAIYASFMTLILVNVAFMFLFRESTLLLKYFPVIPAQIPLFLNVSWKLFMILAGCTIVLIVGILDDIKGTGFSYKKKFLGQFIAAAVVIGGGVKTSFMPTPFLNYLVTALWIVGITNSFNLLDNMDGLSPGVAVISSLMLAVITALQGQFFSATILCVYAGSTAGFLIYNFYPSTIFMGDAGSLFIGFLISTLTITSSYVTTESASLLPVIVPVLALSIPLYDTISVVIIRLKQRRPLFVGDKNHFSHRLLNLGMSERGAVLFIYLIAFCVGITAILLPGLPVWGSIVILLHALIIYAIITVLMILGAREGVQHSGRRPA